VKPANIMITRVAPGLRLLDFGLAKAMADIGAGDGHTRTGMIVGTPLYMAPEQTRGQGDLTDRTDVYAAGVVLFVLLAGRHPFDDPLDALLPEAESGPPEVRTFQPAVPESVAREVARCLHPNPAARPSAADLARALTAFAGAVGTPSLEALEAADAVRIHDEVATVQEAVRLPR